VIVVSQLWVSFLRNNVKDSIRELQDRYEIDECFDNTEHIKRRRKEILYFPAIYWGWAVNLE